MNTCNKHLYLGIDAGGTQTRAMLISASGDVIRIGYGGSGNHIGGDLQTARSSISQAVREALWGETPESIAFGSSGLEEPGDVDTARSLLPPSLQTQPVVFDTDALMALEGALGGQPGIVLAAGTGAIAFGRSASGTRAYASGWGWKVGDEGSAYWIGNRAITMVCRATDGRAPATALTAAILDTLGLSDCRSLRDWVYMPERQPADMAQFAQVVDQVAGAGDQAAITLITDAAQELADAVEAVYKKVHQAGDQHTGLAWTGGVFNSQQMRRLFQTEVARRSLSVDICDPVLPPIAGAALHAWRLGNWLSTGSAGSIWQLEVPDHAIERLRISLANV